MFMDSFKERWFFKYWTQKRRKYLQLNVLTCDSEGLSVINEMSPKPERVQERKMVFLWCITEFLAPVNQVKSRPCICHHLQAYISLMLSEAQVEMLPGFGFILKTLCPLEKSSGVIVSEEDDYNDLDVDEFMTSAGYRCKDNWRWK